MMAAGHDPREIAAAAVLTGIAFCVGIVYLLAGRRDEERFANDGGK
jgi:hypothetical protein